MRYLSSIIIAAAFLFFHNNADAQVKRVAVIGSSTAANFNVTYLEGFVGRLDTFYNKIAPHDTMVYRGATGGYSVLKGMPTSHVPPEGTGGGSQYQPDPLQNITWALNPIASGGAEADVVIVNYPSNLYDVLPISRIMASYREIRDSAAIKGKPCYITTTQPRNVFDAPSREKLRVIKDSILNAFGYFAIDFWTDIADVNNNIVPAYSSGDGIHLNAAGQRLLFDRILEKNIFAVALPANFLKFEVSTINNHNLVKWSTTREQNVALFEIERSDDGLSFTKLASVNARGNSLSSIQDYEFTDVQPLKAWNYYRIMTVDKDGKKQQSPVFKVFIHSGQLSIRKVFNQPSQVVVEVFSNNPQQADIRIINSQGLIVRKESRQLREGIITIPVPTSFLATGIYYLQISSPRQQPLMIPILRE